MKSLVILVALLSGSFACFSQSFISRTQAIADLDFYHATLQEVHYNPFLFVEKTTYFSEVEKLKNSLPDSIAVNQLIIKLYQLTSLMKDGHSSPYIVQPVFKEEMPKEQFFPYSLLVEDNRFYVSVSTAAVSGIPVGAEVTAINQQQVKPLLKQANNYNGGNVAFRKEMTAALLSYYLFLSDIKAPFVVEYKDASGKKKTSTIEKGLPFGQALAVTLPAIKGENSFKIVDNKLGYIDFVSMSGDWKAFNNFLDSCFTTFAKHNIRHVAIDVRKNSGGNSMLGEVLLSYVTDKKFKMMGGRSWKVSQQYKDYLLTAGMTEENYLKIDNGSVWELGSCEPTPNRFVAGQIFTGEVYLLTGPFTYSSANMLADAVKQFKLAQVIGESTGENTNDFGEVYSFELPNSKIQMNTTTAFDYGANCNKAVNAPVSPDVHIPTTLEDKINERDAVLAYLLARIL